MDAMEMLWSYMQEDMKAERIKNEIRNSPLRQKLERSRDQILEQQAVYKKIEEQVAIHTDRKDAIQDALTRAQEQLDTLIARIESNPPADAEAADEMIRDMNKCHETLRGYEQELRRIHQEAREFSAKSAVIRQTVTKEKRKFDQMKVTWTAENESKKAVQDEAQKAADARRKNIPAELLSAYDEVKRHVTPPMARLQGNQCSGCNTSQPSAALRKIEGGAEIVECETCGRILIK